MHSVGIFTLLLLNSSLAAQQRGQWIPGQMGLNARIVPEPGMTFVNIDIDYTSSKLNGPRGNGVPIQGSYDIWAVENLIYYVPDSKLLGGKVGFMIGQPTVANGSATLPQFGLGFGGFGAADTFVQPFTLGWSMKRVAFYGAYGFFAPTGRYTPGAANNIGSGYWGDHFMTGTTLYLTKNQGTSANLFTDWEFHGSKQGTNNTRSTPGQAFTTEWGVGQALPLKKDLSMLAQLGGVGYDQWQVSDNGGTIPNPIPGGAPLPASLLPRYSVHAAGLQANFIMPGKNLSAFFKSYWEYSATARPIGRTLVIGGTWTLRIPKAQPGKSH